MEPGAGSAGSDAGAGGGPGTGTDEAQGKVDLVSILYIFGGVPVICLFLAVLFGLARACNIPA